VTLLLASLLYSWQFATAYTDGKPLAFADIASTLIEWGTCTPEGLFGAAAGSASVPAPTATYEAQAAPGTYCHKLYTVLKDGRLSAPATAGPTVVVPGVDPDSPQATNAVVVGRTFYRHVQTSDGHWDLVDTGVLTKRGVRCHLLEGMGIWGPYGYGVVGGDIAICRRD
jgi:hypothetical protein